MRADEDLPRLLHRGERALFEWPGPSLKSNAKHAAVVHIDYSATSDGPVRKSHAMWISFSPYICDGPMSPGAPHAL